MRRIKITRGNLLPPPDWNQFKQFLLHGMNDKTAAERIRYSKQFVSVLTSGDASPLMQVTPDKRIHAMKGLASLARFTGQYDYWMQIKRRYNLTWTSGRENLTAFQRFFDDSRTLDSMLQWVREAIQVVPPHMGKIIRFNTLTGLRPNEAIAAVRLLNTRGVYEHQYYNTERQTLEHFRFHEVFLRRTKSAYVSIVTKEMLSAIAPLGHKPPTYEAIRFRLERSVVKCHLGYCRKVYGSWLRKSGIESETVDLLQGRVPQTVFAKHYFTPDLSLRARVIEAVGRLQKQLNNLMI